MRLKSTLLAMAVIPGALAFTVNPASVAEGCRVIDAGADAVATSDDVVGCASTGYLSCNKALDAGVTGKVHNLLETVDLTTAAPTTSFTAGGGCGEVEVAGFTGTAMNNIYDLNIAGIMEGNVDSVTFELHSIYLASQRTGGTIDVQVRFDVSGKSPNGYVDNVASGTGTVTRTPRPITFKVDPTASSTGLSESFLLTVTDLHKVFPELNKVGNGGQNYHAVNATIHIPQNAYVGPWVWGATEVPASITFNRTGDLGTTVSATTMTGGSA